MSELEEVIGDAVQDATAPIETPETGHEMDEMVHEMTPEAVETPQEAAPEAPETQVPSPSAKAPVEEDDFAKKYGLPAQKVGERENRIPYSAVKRIVGNAEKKAIQAALDPVNKELTEYKTKVTDYEARLQTVDQFEKVMLKDPSQFLNMLTRIPAYKQIFENLVPKGQQAQTPAVAPQAVPSDMPQPDQVLTDGSKVYSLEGFQKLQDWNKGQIEAKVLAAVNQRLQPFDQERQYREWQAKVIPQIQHQIDSARKWVQFNENEEAIVKALQADPQLSLQDAYIQVVVPKLSASTNEVRQRVIQDMRKAPVSTSVPGTGVKPQAQQPSGPRDLESIIAEAAKNIGR